MTAETAPHKLHWYDYLFLNSNWFALTLRSQVLAGALPLHQRILMVSGRVSFEIVQKAAVSGVPIICAVSAPSDLAIDTAERLGVTLVGFLRGDGFNVYSHDGRIDLRDLSGLG